METCLHCGVSFKRYDVDEDRGLHCPECGWSPSSVKKRRKTAGNPKKDFRRPREEIDARVKWLVQCVYRVGCLSYESMSRVMHDDRYNAQDVAVFGEIIGYTMSHLFEWLHEDMEREECSAELIVHYVLTMAEAFDRELGFELRGSGMFDQIFLDYDNPKYDPEYYKFWEMPVFPDKQGKEKTLGEIMKDDIWVSEHNPDLYYAYRLNKQTK